MVTSSASTSDAPADLYSDILVINKFIALIDDYIKIGSGVENNVSDNNLKLLRNTITEQLGSGVLLTPEGVLTAISQLFDNTLIIPRTVNRALVGTSTTSTGHKKQKQQFPESNVMQGRARIKAH